jgi:hypothetical protein
MDIGAAKQDRRARPRRRGSALIASLMVVLVVAGLGVCMVRMHNATTRRQVQAIDKKRAFYVAEAGLSEAFLAVSQGKSGNVASEQLPARFGEGVYWVEATSMPGGNVALTSTGLCGVGRFSVSVVLRSQVDPVASRGIFGRDLVLVEAGVIVDGYDSREGTYAEQAQAAGEPGHTEEGARLGSNAGITLESDVPPGEPGEELPGMTMVFGEVTPGPAASVTMEPGVLVTGSTAPSSDTGILPPVEVPGLESQGTLVHDTDATLTLGYSELRYDMLRVRSGSILRIQGPVRVVTGGFWLESGSRLVIDSAEGPVTIVVTEFVDFKPDSVLATPAGDPLGVTFMISANEWQDHDGDDVPDPPVRIGSRGMFHGFMYAPESALILPRSLRFYGAAAARRLKLSAGMRFTVDQALASGENGIDSLPQLVAWEIAELPDSPLVKLRLDPRGILKMNGLDPPPSADAHAEQLMDIAYFDGGGTYRTYSGLEQDFDWQSVGSLVSVDWRQ